MIIMPVPKDIRNVKAKFIGPFTKRQTYAIVPAAYDRRAVVVGLLLNTFLGKLGLPSDLKVVITIAAVSPIIACGFIDVCDMPLAVFLRDVAIVKFFAPKCRPYVTENTFDKLAKQSKITYEYFDGDDKEYTDKEMKKKQKLNKKRLEKYLKTNPDMKPID